LGRKTLFVVFLVFVFLVVTTGSDVEVGWIEWRKTGCTNFLEKTGRITSCRTAGSTRSVSR